MTFEAERLKERNSDKKYAQHYSYDLYNSYHAPVNPYLNAQVCQMQRRNFELLDPRPARVEEEACNLRRR